MSDLRGSEGPSFQVLAASSPSQIHRDHGLCRACGRSGDFEVVPGIINSELRSAWGIGREMAAAFDRRESLACPECGCSLRTRRLAEAVVATYAPSLGLDADAASLVDLLGDPQFRSLRVAEINSCGMLHNILAEHPRLAYSEYAADSVAEPRERDSRPSQDLQALTYPEASFDLILTSDTLEHVPQPERAWQEIARVLAPGGFHIFTIPVLPGQRATRPRAHLGPKGVVLTAPPAYHGCGGEYLVFTDFGVDVADNLGALGLRTDILFFDPADAFCIDFVFRSWRQVTHS